MNIYFFTMYKYFFFFFPAVLWRKRVHEQYTDKKR